jgi:ribulose-bisphosphate carboxylase large chain
MSEDRISATYRLRVAAGEAAQRAAALALEQSLEMPAEAVTDRRVLQQVAARVERVEPQRDGSCIAVLSLSLESVGADAGQLMNMLFGNCSLQPDVELADVDVPDALARSLGGPNHGIDGLRRLAGVSGRPLTCTALKPIGSSTEHLAQLCATFARAGIDVIKDDHGWADQTSSPFAQRVAACQRAVAEADAPGRPQPALYAPSLYGTATQMHRQVELARAHGVRMLLIAPMNCGVATMNELARAHPDMLFMAHPALAGNRIAPAVLLGRLFRLFGADAVIFPNHGGRFSYPRDECLAIARNNRAAWHDLRPSMPVPAGGMSVERVAEIRRDYGADSMLLIGGSLLIAGERLAERSRAFVDAVAAADEVAA